MPAHAPGQGESLFCGREATFEPRVTNGHADANATAVRDLDTQESRSIVKGCIKYQSFGNAKVAARADAAAATARGVDDTDRAAQRLNDQLGEYAARATLAGLLAQQRAAAASRNN